MHIVQDHLSGTSSVVDSAGNATRIRYGVWGEARDAISNLPTSRLYTGQEKSNTGLFNYNARWYDSYLNRWIQPDSIIPDPYNPLDLDRYSYVRNNPINYNDPTGHDPCTSGSYQSFCPPSNTTERAVFILDQLDNEGERKTWDELTDGQRSTFEAVGLDQNTYNRTEYGGTPGVKDVAGTVEDPIVYISLLLGYGIKGPAIAGGKQLIFACFRNPVCGRLVFGLPTTYAQRLEKQTDPFHSFPNLLDPIIIREGDRIVKNFNYVEYQIKGEIALGVNTAGYKLYQGVFQIGVELRNLVPVITHHFFEH